MLSFLIPASLILIILVFFYLMARICDLHFVPSLEVMERKMNMSPDIAGATLMAMGSSAPELFIAIMAVLKPGDHASIGTGTIVGSAVFNLLVIIGICLIVKRLQLIWQPIVRDMLFYAGSILLLFFTFLDGIIDPVEVFWLLLFYVFYIISFKNWRKIFPYADEPVDVEDIDPIEFKKRDGLLERVLAFIDTPIKKLLPHLYVGRGLTYKVLQKVEKPVLFLFPSIEKRAHNYIIVFFLSIFFIGAISWLMVDLAIALASELQVPEVLIAIFVLAAGSSIPDLLSSVIVTKKGKGNMAVSNAIGSNIFNIQIGLGLPWAFVLLLGAPHIAVDTSGIFTSSIVLLISLLFVFVFFLSTKWKPGAKIGMLLLLLYTAYIFAVYFRVLQH